MRSPEWLARLLPIWLSTEVLMPITMRIALLFLLILIQGCVGTATRISCAFDAPAEPEPTVDYGEFEVNLRYMEIGEEKQN